MPRQHIETLIIGAGQAGLATAYQLGRLGRDCLVVDGNARVGDNWRCHYDSLRLYSPARYDGLPGSDFPGDPWHCPGKDEVADFLEQYAVDHALPVRMRTRVERVVPLEEGGFTVHLDTGTLTCDHLVIATGTFGGRHPHVPALATALDPGIRQLHSTQYHRPADLHPGPTLVVGASHSGYDIAYELGEHGPTILAGPDRGSIPVDWSAPSFKVAMPVIVFLWRHLLTRRTPVGRKVMGKVRHQGAPTTRVKPQHLAERGVVRTLEKVTEVSAEGRPVLAGGEVLDVANVVWATGFRPDYSWIETPVADEEGWPREYRGVSETVPGLYFCGLAFQYAFSSMVLPGVARDSAYVAQRIAAEALRGAAVAA